MVTETKNNIEILGDTTMDDKFYTVQEAATELKVSEATILKEIKLGNIPAEKIGRQWRIKELRLDHKGKAAEVGEVKQVLLRLDQDAEVYAAEKAARIAKAKAEDMKAKAAEAEAAWAKRESELKLENAKLEDGNVRLNEELQHKLEEYKKSKAAIGEREAKAKDKEEKLSEIAKRLAESEADLEARIKKAKQARLFSSAKGEQLAEARRDLHKAIDYIRQIKHFKAESDYILPLLYSVNGMFTIGGEENGKRHEVKQS